MKDMRMEQIKLSNGDIISLMRLSPEQISTIEGFPTPVFIDGDNEYYFEKELPEKYKGVYLNCFNGRKSYIKHSTVKNENLLRCCSNGFITTFWYGKLLRNENEIYACIYPSYYTDNNGVLKPTSVSFYSSTDSCQTWSLKGYIDYHIDELYHPKNLKFHEKGFTEPTFEFLNDNSILCIMRTSGGKMTPMYKSYSSDYGQNWTTPEPFTPNGVMPQLVRLDNDVLVLASGRPGIQLKFSFDGKGEIWSQPIELIDYDETASATHDTCGYPFIYKSSNNEVYIVYSNFQIEKDLGELRKGIMFRKIKVVRI